jgi:hypothetical protein
MDLRRRQQRQESLALGCEARRPGRVVLDDLDRRLPAARARQITSGRLANGGAAGASSIHRRSVADEADSACAEEPRADRRAAQAEEVRSPRRGRGRGRERGSPPRHRRTEAHERPLRPEERPAIGGMGEEGPPRRQARDRVRGGALLAQDLARRPQADLLGRHQLEVVRPRQRHHLELPQDGGDLAGPDHRRPARLHDVLPGPGLAGRQLPGPPQRPPTTARQRRSSSGSLARTTTTWMDSSSTATPCPRARPTGRTSPTPS